MSDLQQDQSEFNVLFVHSDIDDYPLTTEEFRVYAHIARRAGLGEAWPAMASIAKKCRIHEDTARRCIHSLTAYRLLSVEDRSKEGKSNKYRLTRKSQWMTAGEVEALQLAQAELGKTKRAAKRAAKVAVTPPSEMKGGVVNKGRGSERRDPPETKGDRGGETKGGGASETKGDEVYPLKLSLEVAPTAVVNSTELNAQPESRAPSIAVAPPPAVTTTENASLQNMSVAQTADGPGGAGTPDGVNGEPSELTDEEAEFLFGSQDDPAKDPEQVPGGAAVAATVLAEAEKEHDPEATRAILVRNLGGQKKLNTLMEETPPGLARANKSRRLWITDITPERAQELINEARQDKVKHPWTAITDLLDLEVGATILRGSGTVPVVANGGATNVLKPGSSKVEVDVEAAPNAYLGIWEFKANTSIMADVVAATASGDITLRDGSTMRSADLVIKYRKIQPTNG